MIQMGIWSTFVSVLILLNSKGQSVDGFLEA